MTTVDVVIVGAGLAGLSAALRATELGARVVLVEQGDGDGYPCNSRMSGGNLHVARHSPFFEPDRLRREIDATTGGWVDPALRDLIVARAPGTVDWLAGHGARIEARSGGEHEQCVLHPITGETGDRLEPAGRGPDLLLRRLLAELRSRGVTILLSTRALSVRRRDPAWTVGTSRGELDADRVVLADGGFQADEALAAEHLGFDGGVPVRRNSGASKGFALRTCLALGARTTSLGAFYGCLVGADSLTDPSLSPYPMFDYLARVGVLVDGAGQRVADERLGGVVLANALAHRANKRGWVVVDAAGWEAAGHLGLVSVRERLSDLHSVIRGDSLSGVLAAAGLPSALDDVGEAPPFMAFPVLPAVTHTMGGPVVDPTMTVVDGDGEPIGGLAVVGSAAGGFEGGPRAGYVGGLLRGAITAKAWAEAAFR